MYTDTSSKVSPSVYGVIKGQKVEDGSVLIEFYVKHTELLEVGSKIAKIGEVGDVKPRELLETLVRSLVPF